MSSYSAQIDLVALVADKNMEFAFRGLIARHRALGIRSPRFDLFVHPERDPGCLLKGHDFLRPFAGRYAHALVMFDREGCGRQAPGEELEEHLELGLATSGWGDRAACVAIDPELETWAWVDSPHLEATMGWKGRSPGLRSWLSETGRWPPDTLKPSRPKEAFEAALHEVRLPRSSAVYLALAQRVTFQSCPDRAFLKLKRTFSRWFPAVSGEGVPDAGSPAVTTDEEDA